MNTTQHIENETLSVRVVRRIASKYGLRILQSRAPFSLTNRGEFQLTDSTNAIVGGYNYDMSVQEILDYLTALRWCV